MSRKFLILAVLSCRSPDENATLCSGKLYFLTFMGKMIKQEINRHISQLIKIINCSPNHSVNQTSLLERKYGKVCFQSKGHFKR